MIILGSVRDTGIQMSMYTITIVSDLETRVGGVGGYPTLVVLVPGHQNVALHTPVSAPAVWQ